MIGSFNVLK